jgi:hypothetical protein
VKLVRLTANISNGVSSFQAGTLMRQGGITRTEKEVPDGPYYALWDEALSKICIGMARERWFEEIDE